MSDDIIKTGHIPTPVLQKTSSGEHPIMQAVRQASDAIRRGPLSDLKALNKRVDRVKVRTGPPTEDELAVASAPTTGNALSHSGQELEEPVPDTEPERAAQPESGRRPTPSQPDGDR